MIQTETYTVTFRPERLLAVLRAGPETYYGMSLLSAVDTMDGADGALRPPRIGAPVQAGGVVRVAIRSDSSIWERKAHHYLFHEDRLEYWTEVEGRGAIERAYFFRGAIKGEQAASVPGFNAVFNPMPNFLGKQEFFVNERISIAAGNDPEVVAAVRGYGLHGAPLCFVCHQGEQRPCLTIGVLARPGEYNFNAFEMNHLPAPVRQAHEPIVATQAFSLAYHGHQRVQGAWRTPRLVIVPGPGRWQGVQRYVRMLEQYGGVIRRRAAYPAWTHRPVYCTWHDQVARCMRSVRKTNFTFQEAEGRQFADVCTEVNCRRWLKLLAKHKLKPGTLIVDAAWQTCCGDPVADAKKFPDMRKFVDDCHRRDIRVILWHNGWARDGVPDQECLTVDGKPTATDPTHPAFRARVARYVRRLLSAESDCYNADGLKVDGMTGTPGGPGLMTHTGLAGFELARALLELLYREAHRVKADCVIGQFTAFPYFADLCDMARTGDLYSVRGDPLECNRFRATVQRIVMPRVAIDTDGALRFNYILPHGDVLDRQATIGVPCLYQAEWLLERRDFCIPIIRKMTETDYRLVAKSWRAYERRRSNPKFTCPRRTRTEPA